MIASRYRRRRGSYRIAQLKQSSRHSQWRRRRSDGCFTHRLQRNHATRDPEERGPRSSRETRKNVAEAKPLYILRRQLYHTHTLCGMTASCTQHTSKSHAYLYLCRYLHAERHVYTGFSNTKGSTGSASRATVTAKVRPQTSLANT